MSNLLEHPNIQALVNRMSVDEYHKLNELGYLEKKVELIEGVIINKMPKSPLHTFVINFLINKFRSVFIENFLIQSEQPITTTSSEPEPDISVITGSLNDYKTSHPKTARLVVEVSLSTYQLDVRKQFIYAEANIFEYWLINLNELEIEVYKNPINGKYLERKIYRSMDSIEIEGSFIELKDFLQS